MTIQNMLSWIVQAQKVREDSWDNKNPSSRYLKTLKQSLEFTMPEKTSATELEIALSLIKHNWNEVQYWNQTC